MKNAYKYNCKRCGLEVSTSFLPEKKVEIIEIPYLGMELKRGFLGIDNIVRDIKYMSKTLNYYVCPNCKREKGEK